VPMKGPGRTTRAALRFGYDGSYSEMCGDLFDG
jgi:hypothetical protein